MRATGSDMILHADQELTCGDVMRTARAMAYAESCALRPPVTSEPPPPDPSFKFTVTCPKCGGPVAYTAGCKPEPARITAMFFCAPCGHAWQFVAGLIPAFTSAGVPKPRAPVDEIQCGTEQGYQLHRRRRKRGEPGGESCDACKAAHRQYENARGERQPTRKARYENQQAS